MQKVLLTTRYTVELKDREEDSQGELLHYAIFAYASLPTGLLQSGMKIHGLEPLSPHIVYGVHYLPRPGLVLAVLAAGHTSQPTRTTYRQKQNWDAEEFVRGFDPWTVVGTTPDDCSLAKYDRRKLNDFLADIERKPRVGGPTWETE